MMLFSKICIAALLLFGIHVHVVSSARLELGAGVLQAGGKMGLNGRFTLVDRLRRDRLDVKSGPPDAPRDTLKMMTEVAKGSFGEVWRAYDTQLKRDIAVKFFIRSKGNESEEMEYISIHTADKFERDILLAEVFACEHVQRILLMADRGDTRHPGADHICNCIEVSVNADQAYVAQDFCGEELNGWKPRDEKHRSEGAAIITSQMLEVLDLLWTVDSPQRYSHHDIKPSNVAAVWDNGLPNIKVIDWGAMRWAGVPEDFQRGCIWNWDFTAPEWRVEIGQPTPCTDEGYEYAYDMWAVGTLYASLLTGQWPTILQVFEVSSSSLLNFDAMQSQSGHRVPAAVADLVNSMTTFEYAQRPLPWVARLNPALSPQGFRSSMYLGTWRSAATQRKYRLIAAHEDETAPVKLEVLTGDEVRGSADVDGNCIGRIGTRVCCTVSLEYEYMFTEWLVVKSLRKSNLEVSLCPVSFWALGFQERVVDGDTPDTLVGRPVDFVKMIETST